MSLTGPAPRLRFGCYLYQDGLDFQALRRAALACESLGYKTLWLKDNFLPWLPDFLGDGSASRRDADMLECWSTLSALGAVTKRVRLGAILVAPYRNPALTAKMVATLDQISGGRIEVGFSAGWHRTEFEAYGYPFLPPKERVSFLREALEIATRLWTRPQATFRGRYASVARAWCEPKPMQHPHPPLWVGGGGNRTLELVARFANGWNYGPAALAAFKERLTALRAICARKGRRNLRIAWQGVVLLGRTEDELRSKRANLEAHGLTPGDETAPIIASTPSRLSRMLAQLQALGVTDVTPAFADLPSLESLRLFATEVMPAFT